MKTQFNTQLFPTRQFPVFPALLLFLSVLALHGCGESEQEKRPEGATIDSAVIPLVTQHPILDARVRAGDSMLYDLTALIDEGIIVEKDMEIIGMYVRSHGGVEKTDSTLTSMTYRQLLDRALTRDMSRGGTPCEGCNDSIIIMIPGNSTRIFIGKGRKSLQTMIREALQKTEEDSGSNEPPLNQAVNAESWQESIRTSMEGREDIDWVLFGNTLLVLTHDGKKLSDYTYGRILAVVDEVRDMDEFDDVRTLFEQTKTQPK